MFSERIFIFLAALLLALMPLGYESFYLNGSSIVFAANESYQTTANLNLRTGAGTTYKVITVIPKGKQVTLISKHGTWFKVSYSGKTGYVSLTYLKQVTSTSTPKPQSVIYSTTDNLNLRTGAGTTYKVVTVIPKGKQVTLISKHGTWYKVTYSGKTGYVSSTYLKQVPSTTAPKENPQTGQYATTDNLNLRSGAGTKYKVLMVIPKGKVVTLITKQGTWYKVNYAGKTGYVSSQYLKLLTSDNPKLTVKNGITYVDGIIVVTKRYSLPATYNPGESKDARAAFNKMLTDAKKKKISFQVISGFRSYDYQKNLYNRYVKTYGEAEASRFSAKAGHSEHQTGLTFDIGGPNQAHWLKESFDKTAEGKWLAVNAHRFGFIMRYPNGKESITGYMYEPWHFRYVGVERAAKIFNSGKSMEEYYGFSGQ
ncbi:SH3 domain-containing protein [Lederbergia wuyishanensis]|uniref:D-alanyl-D-alanine carboxypeptidase n=1 Tax=Lederbergia wuyishanensis TaxID=1347903 RepID=A0ABU0D5W4_9BACI|nr:SH3 domain-containing protein [Lederbergia wuyishanensis]MCJ8008366.1 SH3 domain-containing protein [Lederbergia wuyishanensis]MDQ0343780.1 D-alanyl-D-alanine carboxypeptidase [Lederbergia wuyishanensis]